MERIKKRIKFQMGSSSLTPLREGEPADFTFRGGQITKTTSESHLSNTTPK